MWRTALLMLLYLPWTYGYVLVAFALMYTHPLIRLFGCWGWLAAYGALSLLWLAGRSRRAVLQSLLVPLPVALVLFLYDTHATGRPGDAASWLLMLPAHGLGVGLLALWRRIAAS